MDRERILQELDAAGVPFELVEHEPAETRELADSFVADRPGCICTKTLYLVNRKRTASYVLAAEADAELDLRVLAEQLGETRLSLASPERLLEALGLAPGVVSPFGLLRPEARGIPLLVERRLVTAPEVSFHPGDNRATAIVSFPEFAAMLESRGVEIRAIDI